MKMAIGFCKLRQELFFIQSYFSKTQGFIIMKTMTCKQLGGACDLEFRADTFQEIAEMSKKHGMEMFQKGDQDHLLAMDEMRILMQTPHAMSQWFENKRLEFDRLPDHD